MIISPIKVIENKWIQHQDCKTIEDWYKYKFISPNAIDITLDMAYEIDKTACFCLSEQTKTMRPISRLPVINNFFEFAIGCYDVTSDFYVDVPEGICAELIIRSTLNRNGLFVTSGLYDSGYKGHIGFMLHNRSGIAQIAPKTRIAQIKFYKAEESGIMYSGGYNHEQGQHWHEDIKQLNLDLAKNQGV